MAHEIIEVLPDSIAHELEISAGDILLSINGKKIIDVLDYRFVVLSEELLLEIQKAAQPPEQGEIWELEIEKDADEDLGLVFKSPLMSEKRHCRNKCVFCFVDQQPPNLRPSLYIKDDDPRLSFLHGNYVTLTNLSMEEIQRIASYHLSPLRISIHTIDLDLRKKMMNYENAVDLLEALRILGDAGIEMHFQVVLCKGLNDGVKLEDTIFELLHFIKGAKSLAIVPAGLTRHREGLYPLEPFTPEDAKSVIKSIEFWQEVSSIDDDTCFVFAADEWYIMSNTPLPKYEHYEDFPQLDNGVGMLRQFENQWQRQRHSRVSPLACTQGEGCVSKPYSVEEAGRAVHIGIVTGYAAAAFMRGLADDFEQSQPNVKISVHAIRNDFFGENITVSGLLTGGDIINQLKNHTTADILFLPENAFRANTEIMLDGITREQLSNALGIPISIGNANGGKFHEQLSSFTKSPLM
ncbi:MAG: DUF512 domain-containing protein [Defluviitaleaceae bacterium]|nr:DUF512 domain-containing protein [Defluviitaleaceae bacterium]